MQADPAPGVSDDDARAALDRALLGFPEAVVYDKAQYVQCLNARLDQGGPTLVIPWERLAVLVAVAVLAALTASVLPARRAVRHSVTANLAAE
ncbi:hypothetical protein KOI35_10510 [Actinoplanes bogorensis]|uniref:Uncharacterized protein n=1 Tax=Paractinoplanes bogorensis TaxID=1610840 RepID=A0ABS5YLK2_9ACTN|nr:hypothetical protein [Actinoplanes bogorensis]MBU2663921.1 hypothetical protein [Actinoplanes bogorensis]